MYGALPTQALRHPKHALRVEFQLQYGDVERSWKPCYFVGKAPLHRRISLPKQ